MTCKDCIHYELCDDYYHLEPEDEAKAGNCSCLKEKSCYIELPCKVGDTVYVVERSQSRVAPMIVLSITFLLSSSAKCMTINLQNYRGAVLSYEISDIGKWVFPTYEEAAKKLEEKQ